MICLLEVLEGMPRVRLCILEAVAGTLCLLEVLEVLEVQEVPEMMRCVLLSMPDAVEGVLCLWKCRRRRRCRR